MKHTKKMILVPEEEMVQTGGSDPMDVTLTSDPVQPKGNKIRRHAAERQRKLLSIVLKLASKQLYDSAGRFETRKGKVEIAPLLMYALSPGRTYPALDEFVELLHKAGVTPDEVINGTVREMLLAKAGEVPTRGNPPHDSTTHRQPDTLASIPSQPPLIPEQPPIVTTTQATPTSEQTRDKINRMAIIAKRRLARRPTKKPIEDHYDMLNLAGVPVPQKRSRDDDDEESAHDKRRRYEWDEYEDDE